MNDYEKHGSEKKKDKTHFQEQKSQAFRCGHCRAFVVMNEYMGTANRNHCNVCLWSKHVDVHTGDRSAICQSGMNPIGLTMKHEGFSKIGELMLIHLCTGCTKISINRIAADDSPDEIVQIFLESQKLNKRILSSLRIQGILLLTKENKKEIEIQLFGK